MKLNFLLISCLALALSACGGGDKKSATSNDPEVAVEWLFDQVKAGEMTNVRTMITSGRMDSYDSSALRGAFGSDDVVGIKTTLLEKKDMRAKVAIVLVTKAGDRPGIKPLTLVWQDGRWQIEYSGASWPSALYPGNYE